MNTENITILERFRKYCDSQGIQKEAQAARLGVAIYDYRYMLEGSRECPEKVIQKMMRIMERREIMETGMLKTKLFRDLEEHVKLALNDKVMITLVGPTGQGKSYSAKHVSAIYGCRYFPVLVDLQKEKKAAVRNFIRDLGRACGVSERSTNNLRHVLNALSSDTRTVLIIDEAQRLITEDWGYFKVLQDLIDHVPNLSIILLGNFRFYEQVYVSPDRTYTGTMDEEQILRRMSMIHKLPRLQASDVKLFCEFYNISLKPSEHRELAEFFSRRAALSDLKQVSDEVIRIMGKGTLNSWRDVNYKTIIAIYKGLHKEISYNEELNPGEEYEKESLSEAANFG
jgi:energy-coupling factor transporter ATP-binding protein EcfA2